VTAEELIDAFIREHAQVAILRLDREGRVQYCNANLRQWLGLDPTGEPISRLLPGLADPFELAHQGERGRLFHISNLNAQPVELFFDFHLVDDGLLLLGRPDLEGVLAQRQQLLDVQAELHHSARADIKRAYMELEGLERRHQLILEAAGDGIFGLDKAGCHTFVNAAAARMLGHHREALIGADSHACWHHHRPGGELYPVDHCPIFQVLQHGEVQEGLEHFVRRDGSFFPVEYIATPIWQHREVVGAVVIFRDISERIEAEEQELRHRREIETGYRQEQHLVQLLTTTAAINQLLISSADLDSLFRESCRVLVDNTPFVQAVLWLSDNSLSHQSFSPKGCDGGPQWRFDAELPGVARVLAGRGRQRGGDLSVDPVSGERWCAVAALRASVDAAAIGVLCVVSAREFQDRELAMLMELGGDIGFATTAFRAREALRESEQRFRQLAENVEEVFWLTEWPGNRTLYLNPPFETIWGIPPARVFEDPEAWLESIHPGDRQRVKGLLVDKQGGDDQRLEYRLVSGDGGLRQVQHRRFCVRDEEGRVHRYAAVVRDVTSQYRHQQQLEFIANHDSLTGLSNRYHFRYLLECCFEREAEAEPSGALLFIGLDRFKNLNDSSGHLAGDRLLVEAAARLERLVTKGGELARLGGDQFAILVVERSADRLGARLGDLVIHIQEAFSRPFELDIPGDVVVTASVGVCRFPQQGRDATELMRHADLAMHAAKRAGRNRVCYFDTRMSDESQRRFELEVGLQNALREQHFAVWYQPQLELASGRVVGAEALVRWIDPQQGMISPASFIPLCEESGLILKLGEWVLGEACRQAVGWRERGLKLDYVAVNISPPQLEHGDFVALVEGVLKRTGATPLRPRTGGHREFYHEQCGPQPTGAGTPPRHRHSRCNR
jgi:diguanylate cyclase (GGDEF)-like protein/PAS domain S-box-containing protein